MQKRWVVVVNVIFLFVVVFSIAFIGLKISKESEVIEDIECIAVNNVLTFVYDACYDKYSKTIFVNVARSSDNYYLNSLEFSFFDFDQQFYTVKDVPKIGEKRHYKIPAEKSPEKLEVRMNIIKDFSSPICEQPRIISVKDCPMKPDEAGVNIGASPFVDVSLDEFIEVKGDVKYQNSDLFSISLVEKETIWESECKSNWKCEEWESCDNGIQRRYCEDTKKCYVPTGKPETVKYCDGNCLENWQCSWSECSGGFTTPDCRDLNNCGTVYEIPKKLSCSDEKKQCIPDIICSDWTSCEVDYNFIDLVGSVIGDLSGSKSRICEDKNKCSGAQEEVQDCLVNVDVYTKKFLKCGKEYVGVYNKLNNDLIARVEVGDKKDSHLNLYLDDQADTEYCDYCFNGVMDKDESGIDCEGGCMVCSEKYAQTDFKKKSWFERLFGWI